MRAKDAASGVAIARVLQGSITRKVIKQTVMTTSYGVTAYGAREQIGRQLKDAGTVPKEKIFEARDYLQHKVFEALDNMFVVSKHIKVPALARPLPLPIAASSRSLHLSSRRALRKCSPASCCSHTCIGIYSFSIYTELVYQVTL